MPCKNPEALARKREKEKLSKRANPEKTAAMSKKYRDNRTTEEVDRRNNKIKEWREKNKDHANEYAKEKIEKLAPSYLAQKIGMPLIKIPSNVLAMKKEIILISREMKKLKEELRLKIRQGQ